MTVRAFCSIAVVVILLWAGGCNDPQAPAATLRRQEKARRPIELYQAREARSPRQLADTIELARRSEQRHAERTIENRRRLRKWADRDLDRWRDNQPVYREYLNDLLRGAPEQIPETARRMFY